MNTVSASIIFLIWAFIISSIKHMFFASQQPHSQSDLGFKQVFQLTKIPLKAEPPFYSSLYQAYYGNQVMNAQKYTNTLKNKEQFNQTVLSESILNEQKSYVCGSNFLIMILSGMKRNSRDQMNWLNVIEVYELPLMRKLDEVAVFGMIALPSQCKYNREKYSLGIILQNRPMLLTIDKAGKIEKYVNQQESIKQILFYDYSDSFEFWAYSVKSKPWVIKIVDRHFLCENASSSQIMKGYKNHLSIDLLKIQSQENRIYEIPQFLAIRQIFVTEIQGRLYVTCLYQYRNSRDKVKLVIQASFLIEKYSMSLLSRVVLQKFQGGSDLVTDCVRFYSDGTYDLSCTICKSKQLMKFVNVIDIFNFSSMHKKRKIIMRANSQKFQTISEWIEDYLQYNDTDDDLIWMLQKMTPLAETSYFPKQEEKSMTRSLSFSIHKHVRTQILKPSLPDPIFLVDYGREHKLYSFKVPSFDVFENNEEFSIPLLEQAVIVPNSHKMQQRSLINTHWEQNEQLLIVIWGGGIDLYQYQRKNEEFFGAQEGITMAVMLPFIELFATVFCMLQMIWSNAN